MAARKLSFRLTKAADSDLEEIYEYGIETFGPQQATQYQEKLNKRLYDIALNPYHYPAVASIQEGYRRSVCGVHSIYYRINDNTVEVIRILSRQNHERLTKLNDQ